jgi:hypothetical protein
MYYKAHPAIDMTRLALVQVGVWAFGGALFGVGVALIYRPGPQFEPVAAVGSLVVFASLLMVAWIVFPPQTSPIQASSAAE